MLKGNKGEWSEIYAFSYLLASGMLQAADKDLNPVENVYFPIIKILRENMSYCPPENKDGKIRIYRGDTLCGEITGHELDDAVKVLYREILDGKGTFEIPSCNEMINSLNIRKIKAASVHKNDIVIQLHDINTGITPVCGFSIKSFLGNNPTLVNAGRNTNFIYRVDGCNGTVMNEFNAIKTKNKLIDRMNYLKRNNCRLIFSGSVASERFCVNMKFIDSFMPQIMAECLLNFYSSAVGTKSVSDVAGEIAHADTLRLGDPGMYEYKIKLFLCACALGMTPEKKWTGGEDADGGYITVKRDGSVVCYHIYNRTDFHDYLYNYTYFEKGSSSKHGYLSIYAGEDGDYYMCLNLQIRFKDTAN